MEHNKKHLVYRDGVRMFDAHCPACIKEQGVGMAKTMKKFLNDPKVEVLQCKKTGR